MLSKKVLLLYLEYQVNRACTDGGSALLSQVGNVAGVCLLTEYSEPDMRLGQPPIV